MSKICKLLAPARVNAEALGNNSPRILALKAKSLKKLEPNIEVDKIIHMRPEGEGY